MDESSNAGVLLDDDIPWSRGSSPCDADDYEDDALVADGAKLVDHSLRAECFARVDEDDARKPVSLPGSISASSTTTMDLRKVVATRALQAATRALQEVVGMQADSKRGLASPRTGSLTTTQCGASVASTVSQPSSGASAARLQRVTTAPVHTLIQLGAAQVRLAQHARRVSPVRQETATPLRSISKATTGKTPNGTPVLSNRTTARLSPVQFSSASITQPTVKSAASSSVSMRPVSPVTMRSTSPAQTASATQVGTVETPAGGSVGAQAGTPTAGGSMQIKAAGSLRVQDRMDMVDAKYKVALPKAIGDQLKEVTHNRGLPDTLCDKMGSFAEKNLAEGGIGEDDSILDVIMQLFDSKEDKSAIRKNMPRDLYMKHWASVYSIVTGRWYKEYKGNNRGKDRGHTWRRRPIKPMRNSGGITVPAVDPDTMHTADPGSSRASSSSAWGGA